MNGGQRNSTNAQTGVK